MKRETFIITHYEDGDAIEEEHSGFVSATGAWCIFPDSSRKGYRWNLTHKPTSLYLAYYRTRQEAMAVMESLDADADKLPIPAREWTSDNMKSVGNEPWFRQCMDDYVQNIYDLGPKAMEAVKLAQDKEDGRRRAKLAKAEMHNVYIHNWSGGADGEGDHILVQVFYKVPGLVVHKSLRWNGTQMECTKRGATVTLDHRQTPKLKDFDSVADAVRFVKEIVTSPVYADIVTMSKEEADLIGDDGVLNKKYPDTLSSLKEFIEKFLKAE